MELPIILPLEEDDSSQKDDVTSTNRPGDIRERSDTDSENCIPFSYNQGAVATPLQAINDVLDNEACRPQSYTLQRPVVFRNVDYDKNPMQNKHVIVNKTNTTANEPIVRKLDEKRKTSKEEYTIHRPNFTKHVSPPGKSADINKTETDNPGQLHCATTLSTAIVIPRPTNTCTNSLRQYSIPPTNRTPVINLTSLKVGTTGQCPGNSTPVPIAQNKPQNQTIKPAFYRDIRSTGTSTYDVMRQNFPNWSQFLDTNYNKDEKINMNATNSVCNAELKREDIRMCTNNESEINKVLNTESRNSLGSHTEHYEDTYISPTTQKRHPRYGYTTPDTPTRAQRLRAAFESLETDDDMESSKTTEPVHSLTDTTNREAADEGVLKKTTTSKAKRRKKSDAHMLDNSSEGIPFVNEQQTKTYSKATKDCFDSLQSRVIKTAKHPQVCRTAPVEQSSKTHNQARDNTISLKLDQRAFNAEKPQRNVVDASKNCKRLDNQTDRDELNGSIDDHYLHSKPTKTAEDKRTYNIEKPHKHNDRASILNESRTILERLIPSESSPIDPKKKKVYPSNQNYVNPANDVVEKIATYKLSSVKEHYLLSKPISEEESDHLRKTGMLNLSDSINTEQHLIAYALTAKSQEPGDTRKTEETVRIENKNTIFSQDPSNLKQLASTAVEILKHTKDTNKLTKTKRTKQINSKKKKHKKHKTINKDSSSSPNQNITFTETAANTANTGRPPTVNTAKMNSLKGINSDMFLVQSDSGKCKNKSDHEVAGANIEKQYLTQQCSPTTNVYYVINDKPLDTINNNKLGQEKEINGEVKLSEKITNSQNLRNTNPSSAEQFKVAKYDYNSDCQLNISLLGNSQTEKSESEINLSMTTNLVIQPETNQLRTPGTRSNINNTYKQETTINTDEDDLTPSKVLANNQPTAATGSNEIEVQTDGKIVNNTSVTSVPKPITADVYMYLLSKANMLSSLKASNIVSNVQLPTDNHSNNDEQNANTTLNSCNVQSSQTDYQSTCINSNHSKHVDETTIGNPLFSSKKTVAELLKSKREKDKHFVNIPIQIYGRAVNGGPIGTHLKINVTIPTVQRESFTNTAPLQGCSKTPDHCYFRKAKDSENTNINVMSPSVKTSADKCVIPVSPLAQPSRPDITKKASAMISYLIPGETVTPANGTSNQSVDNYINTANASILNTTSVKGTHSLLNNYPVTELTTGIATEKNAGHGHPIREETAKVNTYRPPTFSVKIGDKMFVIRPSEPKPETDVGLRSPAKRTTLPAPKPKHAMQSNLKRKNKTDQQSSKNAGMDYRKKIKKMLKKSKDPFEQLVNSLGLMPVQKHIKTIKTLASETGKISFSPTASDVDISSQTVNYREENAIEIKSTDNVFKAPTNICLDYSPETKRDGTLNKLTASKMAVVVQIFKDTENKCKYNVHLSKINNVTGRRDEHHRWYKYADYPCTLHFTEGNKLDRIDAEGLKQGLYLVTDSNRDLLNVEATLLNKVSAVLALYPPHIDSLPANSSAIVVGQTLDSEHIKHVKFPDIDGKDCIEKVLDIVLGTKVLKDGTDFTDMRYASITDSNMSPRCHSPMFYSQSIQNYFTEPSHDSEKHIADGRTQTKSEVSKERTIKIAQSRSSVKLSTCSAKAVALKIKQNELFESCKKLKKVRQLLEIKKKQTDFQTENIETSKSNNVTSDTVYETFENIRSGIDIDLFSNGKGCKRKRVGLSAVDEASTSDDVVDVETVDANLTKNSNCNANDKHIDKETINKDIVSTDKSNKRVTRHSSLR